MEEAPAGERKGRGAERLLLHCFALTGMEEARPSALERLQDVVGDELAEFLVAGLSLGRARLAPN